jgi:hypothetical protein
MKYLKTHMIFESLEKHFKLSESILKRLKAQNTKINDVEDIMLEVTDSWGFSVPPSYMLRDSDIDSAELRFQNNLDYFGMGEGDFDEPEEDYKSTIKFIDDIRSGKRSNLILDIEFQYANEHNRFKPLSQTDEQKEILSEVDERLKSIGCEIDYEYTPEGSNLGQGLWKMTISVPVKFQPENVITSLDGFSKDLIKDFTQFVKDYSIDTDGQAKLSNLIRRAK